MEIAFDGIEIVNVEVLLDSLQAGSLREKFLIKYLFKGKENYDRAKEVIEKIMEDNTAVRTVVAVGIGVLITYGIMKSIDPGAPSQHIEAYNNTIINIGGEVELNSETIDMLLIERAHFKQ